MVMKQSSRVVVFANPISRCGKTISAVNFAATLGASEYRTLLIDLDPQAHAGACLGVVPSQMDPHIYDVLYRDKSLSDVMVSTALDNLKVVPASARLLSADVESVGMKDSHQLLRRAVNEVVDDFDMIIIDTPSAAGILTINAWTAADHLIIPVQIAERCLEGLNQLFLTVETARRRFNLKLKVDGLVLTHVDSRSLSCLQMIRDLRDAYDDLVFESMIVRDPCLSESADCGRPALLHDASSAGAGSYLNLSREWLYTLKQHDHRFQHDQMATCS